MEAENNVVYLMDFKMKQEVPKLDVVVPFEKELALNKARQKKAKTDRAKRNESVSIQYNLNKKKKE